MRIRTTSIRSPWRAADAAAAGPPPPAASHESARGGTKENKMMPTASRTWRVFVVGAAALSLATVLAAQATQTKETVPGGPASVKTTQVKGELVAKGSNWLIAKDLAGYYKLYNVQPGRKAIVDGVPKTLDQLPLGTMLTSTATTTQTPLVNRTTTITKGTVFWASPKSIIVTLDTPNGQENKQYEVPSGFMFDVEGKKLSAMELRPGMKVAGTKIVEEPATVITQDVVVTGTAPK
jgi:hypothetical protein